MLRTILVLWENLRPTTCGRRSYGSVCGADDVWEKILWISVWCRRRVGEDLMDQCVVPTTCGRRSYGSVCGADDVWEKILWISVWFLLLNLVIVE